MRKRRWSDDQKQRGPFTWSRDTCGRPFGVMLDSGHDEYPGCHLMLRGFGHTLIVELPAILKPWRRWIGTGHYEWATSPDAGYWEEHARRLGFQFGTEGFLQVFLGPQTHDSVTTKNWSCFLPWTQWRHVRFSLYGLNGEHVWTQLDRRHIRGMDAFAAQRQAEEACPKVTFAFEDDDGQRIEATTHIEEREWRKGEGWFRWLSRFQRPKIRRDLEMKFSAEVGPEKGSWKGGTVGTGFEMLPGELHEAAFRRYCEQEHRSKYRKFRIKFLGRV